MTDQADEHIFRHLHPQSGVALIVADENEGIRFMNRSAEELFGKNTGDLVSHTVCDLFPIERRQALRQRMQQSIQQGESSEFDFWFHRPQNPAQFLAVVVSPIFNEESQCVGVSLQLHDLTQRMEMLRELADREKMSALGSMAGAVAHHFNNLLGGIMTSADFAMASDDPRTLKRALSITLTALTRANDLILSLLAFAEGDRTNAPLTEACEIVKVFADTIRRHLEQHRIELDLKIAPLHARLPGKQIMSVLNLLTTNALEAMPDGGTLLLELSEEDQQAIFRVGDTGDGIPEAYLPHVFEPFFTTKNKTCPSAPEHPGLGLSVVHGIVKDLGGLVTLSLQPGGGTLCTVRIPYRQFEDPCPEA